MLLTQNIIRTIIMTAVIIGLCSCCKMQHEQGSVKPEWYADIPTFESPEIFYDGLPNMPQCGDLIIAHTTIYDGGFWLEDNRLCAIDVKSGNTVWYFPADLATRHNCSFNAEGYTYEDKLVFQYRKTEGLDNSSHTTVCLNAKSGKVIWELEKNSVSWDRINKDVVGYENYCFFVHGENEVCRVDLSNDDIETFYDADSLHISGINLSDKYLVVSCDIPTGEEFQDNRYCLVLDRNTGALIIPPVLVGSGDIRCKGMIYGDVLYATLDTEITAIDVRGNRKLWERSDYWAYFMEDMYLYGDVLLKCCAYATVGYNKNNGEIIYDYRDYGSWYTTVHQGYAYLVSLKDELDIIDIATGQKVSKILCPDREAGFIGSYPMI